MYTSFFIELMITLKFRLLREIIFSRILDPIQLFQIAFYFNLLNLFISLFYFILMFYCVNFITMFYFISMFYFILMFYFISMFYFIFMFYFITIFYFIFVQSNNIILKFLLLLQFNLSSISQN